MKQSDVPKQIQWEAAKILEAIDTRQAELIALAEVNPTPELAKKLEQIRKAKKRISNTFRV